MEMTRRILPKCPGKLAVAHIQGIDAGGPTLQQAIGEPAGRGPDIGAHPAVRTQTESIQRRFEFEAAAADVTQPGLQCHLGVVTYLRARLARGRIVHHHLARQDESLGLGARFDQPSRHQQIVETEFAAACERGDVRGIHKAILARQSAAVNELTKVASARYHRPMKVLWNE